MLQFSLLRMCEGFLPKTQKRSVTEIGVLRVVIAGLSSFLFNSVHAVEEIKSVIYAFMSSRCIASGVSGSPGEPTPRRNHRSRFE